MEGHDHSMMNATATAATSSSCCSSGMDMAAETAAAAMDHSGHGGSGSGATCKISMLWNWTTIDACFLSSTWHVRSKAMFAGSCIGVILLVVLLELLRRTVKEYDRYLIRQHVAGALTTSSNNSGNNRASESSTSSKNGATVAGGVAPCAPMAPFRPSVLQQAVRALLHMCQFAVAYFIMLLAMYFNGYIIICIFIGAYIGSFIFHWETLVDGNNQTSASREATVCCG